MFDRLMRLRLDPEGSDGGGTSTTDSDSATTHTSSKSSEQSEHSELASKIESLLRKNDNQPNKVIEKLFEENFSLRDKRRQDKSQYEQRIKELQDKAPGADAVVLSGEELAAWNELKEMGGPAAVKARLQELTPYQEKVQAIEREKRLAELAEPHHYNPKVLGTLLSDELAEKAEYDKKQKKVYLNLEEGKERISLDQYAEQHWKDFLPALKAGSPGSPNLSDPRRPKDETPQGIPDDKIRRLARF